MSFARWARIAARPRREQRELLASIGRFPRDGAGLHHVVLGLEQEFGIKVEDEEVGVKAFASVDALCDFIEQKKIA